MAVFQNRLERHSNSLGCDVAVGVITEDVLKIHGETYELISVWTVQNAAASRGVADWEGKKSSL